MNVLRIAIVFIVLLGAAPAAADLRSEADTLASVWRRGGAQVDRRPPMFIEAGQVRRLAIEAGLVPGTCVTLVALSARPLRLSFEPVQNGRGTGMAVTSDAGVLVVEDCDGGLLGDEARLGIESGRGAVEIIVVRHEGPITAVATILPARAVGLTAPREDDAGPLVPAPAVERLARARRSAELDGAELIVPVTLVADDRGQQIVVLNLPEGCHRLVVIADASFGEPVDVDAEAVLAEGDKLLRRDRSHAPDARLEFCLGAVERVELRMVGAAPQGRVSVIDAQWSLPPGLPEGFGSEARAGVAWALFRRRAPRLESAPIAQFLGGSGATLLPIALEPGACYVAAHAVTRGRARAARLSVTTATGVRYDEAGDEPFSAAVTFCAEGADRATAQVDVLAEGGFWLFSLWRLGDPP